MLGSKSSIHRTSVMMMINTARSVLPRSKSHPPRHQRYPCQAISLADHSLSTLMLAGIREILTTAPPVLRR